MSLGWWGQRLLDLCLYVSSSVKNENPASSGASVPTGQLNSAVVSCSLQGEINTESRLGQAVGHSSDRRNRPLLPSSEPGITPPPVLLFPDLS